MIEQQPVTRRIAWFTPWAWKPWKRWAAITLLLLVPAYIFSIGPALLLTAHGWLKPESVALAYRPLLYAVGKLPAKPRELIKQYWVVWGGLSTWADVVKIHGEFEYNQRNRRQLRLQ